MHNDQRKINSKMLYFIAVLFCSGFRLVSGCGTIGEHVAAPGTEPES
jgi:hypothetical protein